MSVCYKTRPDVHLIVTCTRRKTVAAGDAVFPDERDVEGAYRLWMERLAQARRGSPPMTAGELYTGQHWSRAAAAAARSGAEMWILSAGLGLLGVSLEIGNFCTLRTLFNQSRYVRD